MFTDHLQRALYGAHVAMLFKATEPCRSFIWVGELFPNNLFVRNLLTETCFAVSVSQIDLQ